MNEQDKKKKNHTALKVVIGIIILIILILLLLKGCLKCEPATAPGPVPPTATEAGTPAEPVDETTGGRIFVESAGEMEFRVFTVKQSKEGKKQYTEVAKENCNMGEPLLKPGQYLVKVYPKGKSISLGLVTVESQKTAKLKVTGFGTLKVGAVQDFMKYSVLNEAESVVGEGDTNITTMTLAAGNYTVVARPGGYPPVTVGPFELKDGEHRSVGVKGFGRLKVGAVKDFLKLDILDADGKKVSTVDSNITVLTLPAGTYTAVTKFKVLENVTIGPFELQDGEHKMVSLKGFGTAKIAASKDFLKYAVIDSSGKELTSGDTNISVHLLPLGTYSLRFGKKTVSGLVIKEGDQLSFKSGL